MSINPINDLLEKAKELCAQRQFDKAIDSSTQARVLSKEKNNQQGVLRSNLLLANIYNTRGNYAGDKTQIFRAIDYLQLIENTAHNADWDTRMDVLYTLGSTYHNAGKEDKAKSFFEKLETESGIKKDPFSLCRSKIALSGLAMDQNDFQQALVFAHEAQELVEQNLDNELNFKASVYALLGQIYIKSHDYTRSLKYSQELLVLSKKNEDIEKEIIALKNLGIVSGSRADFKESMEFFLEALDRSKSINFRKQIAQIQINIATIYANLYNYNEALQRYEAVLEDYNDVIDKNAELITLNNVGNIHYTMNQFEKALPYFKKANDLATEAKYTEMMAHTFSQISRSYTAIEELDMALEFAQKAQRLNEQIGEISGRQINLINLGEILYKKEQYGDASRLISQGAAMAKRMDDNASEIRAYRLLAAIFEAQKDFEKALQYQKIYAIIQDKFSEVQRNRLILDMEINYSIKEKQKAIEQLKTKNKLQALLLEKQDQISTQNEQLTEANEELKQFAYVASHDLKEPLRMIGSYTQIIHKLYAQEADAETALYFEYVNGGVIRMNSLLDALLQYATIGRTTEQKIAVNLADIVDICCLHLKVRIEETGAIVRHENLPIVVAVRSLMLQLFQNLISNAIKFRKSDLPPVVKINCLEQEQEYLISIKDNGIGIAPEFKERIFIIFQRLHSDKAYEGTGIGLAICQKIIKRMNGNIWVESELDQGANFFISLPKSKQVH